MTEELKPCWCGELPDLMKIPHNGKTVMQYMCDQTIDEHLPHALMADDAESEEGARREWNRMMDAIEKHYREGGSHENL